VIDSADELLRKADALIARRRNFVGPGSNSPDGDLPVLTDIVETAGDLPQAPAAEPDPAVLEMLVQQRVEEVLPQRVEEALPQRIADVLPQELEDALAQRLADILPREVESALAARIAEVLPQEIEKALPERLAAALPAAVAQALPAAVEQALPNRLAAELPARVEAALQNREAEAALHKQPRIDKTLQDWVELDLPQVVSRELETALARIMEHVTAQLYHTVLPEIDTILAPAENPSPALANKT
jgi:hypothetical protein